jgi:nucleotide-binding universal stress UspA family protein
MMRTPTPARQVVVGVDGSPNSVAALRRAAQVAARRGAALRAVFAYSPGTGDDASGDADRSEALGVLADCVQQAFDGRPERLELVPGAGTAWRVLAAMSAEADLLVVGARGQSAELGMPLGSTAQACVRHAGCPTLVVPPARDVPPQRRPTGRHAGESGGSSQPRCRPVAASTARLP